MVRHSRMISALMCAGLLMTCITGCGSAGSSAETGDEVRAEGNIDASDGVGTAAEPAADEANSFDAQNENKMDAADSADNEDSEDIWKGCSLSILGDSISTYDGWIPEGCAVFYPESGELTDVSQTWWMSLIEDTGMELCSNGSSSGSTCVGDSLSIDEPKYGCSDYRISLLAGKKGKMPDVIIVYMGTNDLLIGLPIGDNDGTKFVEEGMIDNFSDAYTMILDKLESQYPAAQIYCCTLTQVGVWGTDGSLVFFENVLGLTAEDYSKQIEIMAASRGIPVIDLYRCGIEINNLGELTSDGVHLTPDGMRYIEQAALSAMGVAQE